MTGQGQIDIQLHQEDLPAGLDFGDAVAVDTETMGLNILRDRLCLAQLSAGDGTVHLVQFQTGAYNAPNLVSVLSNPDVTKIFHFARFDIAVLRRHFNIDCMPLYCTKTASKLCRTSTDRHGLKDLCRELLGVDISKQQQTSDWGAAKLSKDQLQYAASDVLFLHDLKARLDALLEREDRTELAASVFGCLPTRAWADLAGWADIDIFAH